MSKKRYVGQTIQPIHKRIHQHFRNSRYGHQSPLYHSMRKYTRDIFEISILEECDINLLDEREQYWISHYKTLTEGYNCNIGGGSGRGYKHTEETRRKISETWKKKGTSNRKGKTNSTESNIKRSQTLKESYSKGSRKERDYSEMKGKNNVNYKHGLYSKFDNNLNLD